MRPLLLFVLMTILAAVPVRADPPTPARGLIPRARGPITLDGRLDDWTGAFATPVNFGHANWPERAAVWRTLWDDDALYVALECLDTHRFNADPGHLYDGDGVEFYLDAREPGMVGNPQFTPGTLHLFYTAFSNGEVKPRVEIRSGIPAFANVTAAGIQVAATATERGYTMEFRLPWSKLPGFKPAPGREIGIDCELCSSDGGPRVDRSWVYGGVGAVGSPAAFGRVRLVDTWDPANAGEYSRVLFPGFVARGGPLDEPSTLFVGISPALQERVRRVELKAGGRTLPFVGLDQFGPGWLRVQACLVGFVQPEDAALDLRILGDGDRVLGERRFPLK